MCEIYISTALIPSTLSPLYGGAGACAIRGVLAAAITYSSPCRSYVLCVGDSGGRLRLPGGESGGATPQCDEDVWRLEWPHCTFEARSPGKGLVAGSARCCCSSSRHAARNKLCCCQDTLNATLFCSYCTCAVSCGVIPVMWAEPACVMRRSFARIVCFHRHRHASLSSFGGFAVDGLCISPPERGWEGDVLCALVCAHASSPNGSPAAIITCLLCCMHFCQGRVPFRRYEMRYHYTFVY